MVVVIIFGCCYYYYYVSISQFILWPLFPPTKHYWKVTKVQVFPLVHKKADVLRLYIHYSGCTTPPSTSLIAADGKHHPLHCTDYSNHTVLISNNLPHCSGCIFTTTSQASNYYWHYFHSVSSSLFSGFDCQLLILL